MKLTVVTVSNVALKWLIQVNEEIRDIKSDALDLRLYYVGKKISKDKMELISADIIDADMSLIDLMGAPREIWEKVAEACKNAPGNIVPISERNKEIQSCMKLGALSAKNMGMGASKADKSMNSESMMKMMNMAEKIGKAIPIGKPRDMKNLVCIGKYWGNSGLDDIRNLLYLIMRDYGDIKCFPKAEPPRKIEEIGICDPSDMKYYKNYQEYKHYHGYDDDKPNIAVLYYAHNYPSCTSHAVGKIVQRISEFANVIPIASSSVTLRSVDTLRRYLFEETGKKVSLIVNFMSFRLGAGPMGGDVENSLKLLEDLNAPIMHPFFMTRRKNQEWKESIQGIANSEFLVSVMLPELDGVIEIFPVGAMKSSQHVKKYDLELIELDLIDERVDKLISKIKAWLNLQQKSNKDKRIAVIGYNYPPGEGNLFGGAFLDTFKSIEKVISLLKNNGYETNEISSEDLMEKFLQNGIINSGRWTNESKISRLIKYDSKAYKEYLKGKDFEQEITEQWGQAPGSIMTDNKEFLIPGIVNDNVFIGLQPSRGIHENPEKAYHDKNLLPHHQYIAFYKWLRDEFKADAVIHVGTHGTLEFLRGKECGMSGDCFPDMLLKDIPHIYMYYCGNPAEAMIAKRRSHAVIVSYQPPVFVEGELYGEFVNLESLINEYHEAMRVDPNRCRDIMGKIIFKAEKINLPVNDLHELEKELYRMKRSLIPKGLHVFGEGYNEQDSLNYMKFLLRYDRGEYKSLIRLQAETKGLNYGELLENNDTQKLKILEEEAAAVIDEFIVSRNLNAIELKNKNIGYEMEKTLQFGLQASVASKECFENEGLLRVLAGKYLPAKLAGDIIRSPEVLPSGYNVYQFDPRSVPSEVAVNRGSVIASNTINQYKDNHGEYPKSTAVILWGLETSRTQGETIGQILSYLGVRVNSAKNDFKLKYEIMDLEELKRPRIDVTVNICGFFRDMFPNLMNDLNELFKTIASLDELDNMNYLKRNSKALFKYLCEEGYSKEEAQELSCARLFGPAESEYGTKVTKIFETKNWEEETQIGEAYVQSLNHVYTDNFRGKPMKELLNKNLSVVDIVSQIRSNHEYEVTDLDHYYEFFGGLAKSVEMAKGKKSEVYITDTTGEKVETETVDKSINRGIRTRMLNPKWIDGMLEHKYHGVQKINQRFENVLGLSATTNRVEQWVYDSLYNKYVKDEELRKRLIENNKWAYFSILENMMEYDQREYWDASEEQLEKLKQVYLELEGEIEETV